MTLGERLKERRLELGWTQRDLESSSGVPNPIISQMETGRIKTPSFKNVVRIAESLVIPLDELATLVQ